MHPREDEKYNEISLFVKENQENFYRFVFLYLHNREDTLDVIQNAIIKALININSLKKKELLKTWFYRILINESINSINKNKKIDLNSNKMVESFSTKEKDVIDKISVYDAILQLPIELRTIVVLRFYEDMKIREIAQITGNNINTVKARLYKALALLKDFVGEE